MKPLFIIIQMLCCIPLAGQTIHGLVVNPDKKAIPYANVVLVTKADSSYIAGTVTTEDGKFMIKTLMRSSVDSAKAQLEERMRAVIELAGGKVEFTGGYSGWAPNSESPILHLMKSVYAGLYGNEPKVLAIHAGLECGILSGAYPHWDMVSCGPTIMSPHSPDERLHIPSVEKCWNFIVKVLEEIPEK